MPDARETFKESIRNVVGDYITNEVDLNNLVNYLYKVSIIAFKDCNMQEEYQNLSGINSMDVEGFKKSLHTISVNASRDLMFSVMKSSFLSLKNQIPLSKVPSVNVSAVGNVNTGTYTMENAIVSNSECEFDIDLNTANNGKPTMDVIAKAAIEDLGGGTMIQQMFGGRSTRSKSETPDTIDFGFSPESLNSINKGIPKNIKVSTTKSTNKEDEFDYTGDSSIYTDDSYDSEPSVDTSLDY